MVASIFGAAFDKLPGETQRGIRQALQLRRLKYMKAMNRGYSDTKFVLLADTPGPGRPNTPGYHHTPFYSTKNSSLYINKMLVEAGANEADFQWFNTTLADGTALDPIHLQDLMRFKPKIICLGGKAENWLLKTTDCQLAYGKVHHPQAWKRFHGSERYPLLDLLNL